MADEPALDLTDGDGPRLPEHAPAEGLSTAAR
jgi:hypothetical protein